MSSKNLRVKNFLRDYVMENGPTWDNKLADEAVDKYPRYATNRSVKNILSHHKDTFKKIEEGNFDFRTGQRNVLWGLVS